jgi:hypothetical protein
MIIDTDKINFQGYLQVRSFVEYYDDLKFAVGREGVFAVLYDRFEDDTGAVNYDSGSLSIIHETEADAIRAAIGWCESSPNAILYENKIKKLEKRLAELEKEP